MRDYLTSAGVEFDDRNVRQDDDARAELHARAGDIVVPRLFYRDQVITGFDPEALDAVIAQYLADR